MPQEQGPVISKPTKKFGVVIVALMFVVMKVAVPGQQRHHWQWGATRRRQDSVAIRSPNRHRVGCHPEWISRPCAPGNINE
jgi:hypothetical protein